MFFQIGLGSVLMMATVAIAGLTTWALELTLDSRCDWLRNSKHRLSQGSWAPGGPEGGVLWSTWTMSVEVP